MTSVLSLLLLFVTGWNVERVSSANILFLSPLTSYSHTHLFFYTIKALVSRGHTVTHWNGLKPREDIVNVTHLHSDVLEKFNRRHDIGFDNNNPLNLMLFLPDRVNRFCKICLKDPNFHRLRKSTEKFDLIVIEAFLNECMLPFVAHFRAPFIYMSGLPPLPYMLEATCSPMSNHEFPILITHFTDEMNLIQRTINMAASIFIVHFRTYFGFPYIDSVVREAWNDTRRLIPPLKEIEDQASLFITNTHPTTNYNYFKSSNIVEVGGLHLQPPNKLPKDLENFLNGSGDAGFIVLNFGSVVHGAGMPEATRKIFVAAFSRLPQRVLWKWEDESGMKDLPSNVKLCTWLPPLIDVLSHPKIRLLMTHGGLFSNQEAVWSAVPLIGFPVFGDQISYIVKAQKDGYAIHLNWMTLTEKILFNSIREIINNPKYKEKVQKLSNLMHEQIEKDPPLDKAVHAIEYVIRHRGAPHLRPASCRLTMVEREGMDVMFVLLLFAMAITYFIFRFLCFVLSSAFKPQRSNRLKQKIQ